MQVEGEVTYNNVPLKDFVVERTASYIDQVCTTIGLLGADAFSGRWFAIHSIKSLDCFLL